jgi:cytochrome c oxidase assembly factor CtaG/putative copper export protein
MTDAGAALTLARFALDLAAVLTVGFLLLAVLVPSRAGGDLSGTSVRAMRAGSRSAAVWCLAAVVSLLLTSRELSGLPLAESLSPGVLRTVALEIVQGQVLLGVAAGTGLLAVLARFTLTLNGAVLVLLGALLAVLPPAVAGHTAGAADHGIAVTSLGLHLGAGALWVGGLAAMLLLRMRRAEQLLTAVPRFSTIALVCFVVIGVSGVLNAAVRLDGPADLAGSSYGVLVLLKTLALVALGAIGWVHRRRTIPALGTERGPAAFRRFATVEAAVMVLTVGLAVLLARTAPPADEAAFDPTVALLGYPLPPAPSLAALVTEARLELLFFTVAVALALTYARGLRRLRQRGDRWPAGRSVAWFAGLLFLVLATSSGLGTYGRVLFSAHMAQHMLLAMVVPLCLVLGAPVTLALRALPARGAHGPHGLREVILAAVHSRVARLLANPLVALAIFVGSLYGTYYTGLYELGLRSHVGHLLMHLHFIATGYIFYSMLIGCDPAPSRPPYLFRIVVLFAGMVFHAFFGVAMMESSTVLAEDWYAALDRPWGPALLADQALGGSVAWSFGELPTLGVLAALFIQWVRADERDARRVDRRAERTHGTDEDELEAYNRYLADLGRRAQARQERETWR